MFCFTPSLDPGDAAKQLEKIIISPGFNPANFQLAVQSLQRMFTSFAACCPPPWPAPGLLVTPEINLQSEMWLPLAEIQPHFQRLCRSALTYPPIFASCPLTRAASWAAFVASFPAFLRGITNPARLLEKLSQDADLREKFLFWSFMPHRFYGSSTMRYPAQMEFIRQWLSVNKKRPSIRILDAASGDGGTTYDLTRLLLEAGLAPETLEIEGWTLEPLEVWSAAFGRFPHEHGREAAFRLSAASVFSSKANKRIRFCSADLREKSLIFNNGHFDLILCNGLLGGPIMNRKDELLKVVENLADLLPAGGILLAADHFHDGWKKKIPEEALGDLFKQTGLMVIQAGEGLCGLKPDQ
ncbi:MAG TPA: hypothetical protein VGJ93_11140 [Desulfuromonadaceae bacterium]|jgi:chemotaxis methyl-accepting protein methylase